MTEELIEKKVVDKKRRRLYGETVGTVVSEVGPYRVMVEWPDDRGQQLEMRDDLEVQA